MHFSGLRSRDFRDWVMETINDFTWAKHLVTGRVIEKFTFGDFRAVSLDIPPTEERHLNRYRYRILFFLKGENRPVLSLNLEFSILGAYFLTEQSGQVHHTLKEVDEGLVYEDFKKWALKRAEEDLHID